MKESKKNKKRSQDFINYACSLCNRNEKIPKNVIRYFDVMDDGDPTVPPRFSCEHCGGEMNPTEEWKDSTTVQVVDKVPRNTPCPCEVVKNTNVAVDYRVEQKGGKCLKKAFKC